MVLLKVFDKFHMNRSPINHLISMIVYYAPVAQLDRALDSGSKGLGSNPVGRTHYYEIFYTNFSDI